MEVPMTITPPALRRLNPDKLLLSKWTARDPIDREKHFIVTRLIASEPPAQSIEMVQLEAVYSGRSTMLPWRTLRDADTWLQGWL
jgi:tryptophan-rich hypothetical protein